MEERKLFGRYLRALRVSLRLPLKEASEKLGLGHISVLENWEQGLELPPLEMSKRIAEVYGATEEEVSDILKIEWTHI